MHTETEIPPAPQIDGEAMLEIFVHQSVRFPSPPMNPNSDSSSPFGDGVRLAMIGSKVLEAAYMYLLFSQQPLLKAEEMEVQFSNLPDLVERWVEGYKWREKVRHTADVDMHDPKETRYIMDAYVGAVFLGRGFEAVMRWVQGLVDAEPIPNGGALTG
ncbi:hypothetical protein L226DRAFT_540327 [Lentinus tigrinus ALCF2SS1-7]|uniref:RNase III domain-containing protein n=1 Tax=Lentinus tigrinus ALCF2SS1-6 TaxID=1328759 RepID=A0A5C2RRA5_9APHY|nr:hypothetical protein L227DRAFT_557046 [Lentinus tigrinus ALCF2SS1-6]RPD68792.1 hypothetical protein L226DRAFT_540327 [Lentinus tigrinus ALCF2SS1-7]